MRVLICVLLIAGMLPFAYAEEGTGGTTGETAANGDTDSAQDTAGKKPRDAVRDTRDKFKQSRDALKAQGDAIKEKAKQLREMKKEDVKRIFDDKRQIKENQREMYHQEKARLKTLIKQKKDDYDTKKRGLHDLKEKLRSCTDDSGTDCEELRMKSLEDIKAYLLKGIELALDHLDRLSLRAKESGQFTEEEAAAIIARITEAKNNLNAYKEKITAATTLAEVKSLARELHTAWGKHRGYGHYISNKVANYASIRAAHGLDNLLVTLKCAVASVPSDTADTSELEAEYAKAAQSIIDAKEKLRAIKEKLAAYKETDTGFETLKDEAKSAQEDLKRTYDQARQLLRKLAEKGVNIRACAEKLKSKGYVDTTLVDVPAAASAEVAADATGDITPDVTGDVTANSEAATSS